ncbi:SMI1/KNR4 family protein [uncultured Aquimarina sp.]|uniref:SMI1/KNR4 family protein n=1 Tax=uncultured Aquimarina sp. TaxID=575652 RepID=UPI002618A240|nr:SMI1/KNR4 family protein [uncultured Aquimarina sp.]
MEIKYLKSFADHPTLAGWTNKGLSVAQIQKLETQYLNGVQFPSSYREFLFIAGERTYIEADILDWDWMIEEAEERFEENNIPYFERPIWITDQVDACNQFGFIYLDENVEDPIIYNCRPGYVKLGDKLIEPRPQGKFSNYIRTCVERAKVIDDSLRKRKEQGLL